MTAEVVEVRRALVSVYDKTGLVDFCRRLEAAGVEIVSSGGTAATLSDAGIAVHNVSDVTGHPEILGGRVKTLHPAIHGGILADVGSEDHLRDLAAQGIEPFQLVVSNLYPFRQAIARPGVTAAEAIEEIDIGGPAMVRAAAKNHNSVGIVTSPEQYTEVAEAVEAGGTSFELRRRLAAEAFFHTASYDAAIVGWLHSDEDLPERMVLPLERFAPLRYGENPHQPGAVYRAIDRPSWWEQARVLQGKEMSFNNYIDADAAWSHANAHPDPTCVIVKHTNACGVGTGSDLLEAFEKAWACDPVSAFGGVIAVNRPLDEPTAEAMLAAGFIEVVVAPSVLDESAFAARKNLRVVVGRAPVRPGFELRPSDGGFLGQAWDTVAGEETWTVVSARSPEVGEWADLVFAWRVAAHTKSNAIVVARGGAAVGVGAGDQSRVGASNRALLQAGDRARGAVAASDAFFPFRDGPDALAAAGVTAIIQPGGSVRDDEVIAAADEHGIAMVFTGERHFRH
jgi:phosphoribosylaminoimidazolecarboxamide formyltransferase / IMP cyclohydrolase